ncbi:RpoE-regulated lipoprotein [Citrobacter sp. JGM124]|uniref:RpoE-regulated lipoprotein n=1 Tax=Citrobacter sp. JGM124 TaxID=2799789 RepID=UPI001BAD6042|nr:RpoE-regulated lipoprotein [Citrobacter sp. JGM124]MBS0848888.1 RpoE-regulated lipoprotein [Citrobacter sp. JGM124]
MKTLRLMILGLPLMLAGCSTLSSVQWSSALPWNWFGSSAKVSEQGVAGLNRGTAMNESAIRDGLNSDYHLRNGMKTANGEIVPYFEVLKDNQMMLVINGNTGTVSRIDVMDSSIETDSGVTIGTPFGDLYDKAFGACERGKGDDADFVVCKAPGSSHISYAFKGEWSGPEGLIPADDTLKKWTVNKIIWQR